MDSLSQFALGAAIGVGVMGRRTAVWKAALWGGICGTLPDLDALIDHGDPVRNMTFHRAESHALFWLTLAAPAVAAVIARLQREGPLFLHWWLTVWLALVTHPLLDTMTVYGTQLALPFSDFPYGLGSIFIIDPLYTLPLLVGVGVALWRGGARGRAWNLAGLVLSTAYLGWSVLAQQQARDVALASIRAQGLAADQVLVTPTPFNTLLWRIVAVGPETYHEGYYSLLDPTPTVQFDAFPRGMALRQELRGVWAADRMAWFSRGFFKLQEVDGTVRITDLRMGQEPAYTFSFVVAERRSALQEVTPRQLGFRPDIGRALAWLWPRMRGQVLPPPR